ncbi:MAG: hypothetical protein JNJ54_05585 [Myxococcaceae bacterium]|nr:hypothetical protein [Myxococcaceae bacterium]
MLGLEVADARGVPRRWPVVVARLQRLVLLFGANGVLEAAGRLVPSVHHRPRPIVIEWATDFERHDWY